MLITIQGVFSCQVSESFLQVAVIPSDCQVLLKSGTQEAHEATIILQHSKGQVAEDKKRWTFDNPQILCGTEIIQLLAIQKNRVMKPWSAGWGKTTVWL